MSFDPPRREVTAPGSRWPRATLRVHFVAIILAATLPFLAFMVTRVVADGTLQREVLAANLRSAAHVLAMVVDRELTASRDALAGLAQADTLQRGDLDAFERHLRLRGPLRPGWSRLAMLDADGRLLFDIDAASPPRAPPTAAAEIEALAHAWAARSPSGVLTSVLDTAPQQRATWIGVGATTSGGTRYLLASRVGLDVWQALLEGAAPEGDGYAALFDERHRVLARTLAPQQFVGQPLPASAVAGMDGRAAGAQKTGQLGGGETYVGWQVLDDGRAGSWGVGVGMPTAGFDAAQRAAALWAFAIAAACLLLGLTLALRMAHRVVRPLQQLLRGSDDAGDPPPTSVTEIAQLREAFQHSDRRRDERMALETAARRDAETADRTKDQLLGMLGHELRNPLNAIVTSIEVLRAAEPGSAMAASARAVLTRQVRKLTDMVDELLELGQVMAGQIALTKRPVELQALLGRCVEFALPRALENTQKLQLEAPTQVWIDADESRIEQLMAHLLDNAIQHTPVAGAITVRLAVADRIVSVSVEDTGPGVDAESVRRVFEPFVQGGLGLDPPGGGLGIGLALVKRLVEMHGGSLQAHSSPRGSSFSWRLPEITALPGRKLEPPAGT